MNKYKRVAIVHDFLFSQRGAERVLDGICEIFPNADIFALFGNTKKFDILKNLNKHKITYSILNKFPFIKHYYRYTFFLWPLLIEQFDLSNYDLVISSSSAVAKNVLIGQKTKHIAYIHSPMRYLWDLKDEYFRKGTFSLWKRILMQPFLHYIRIWDVATTRRIKNVVSISKFVSYRIKRIYNINVKQAVYPFVQTEGAISSKKKEYYLYFGPLEPNKGVLQTVECAKRYGLNLKIVGDGSLYRKIKRSCRRYKNIKVVGWCTEKEKWKYLSKAKALIYPSIEDFGIVPLEANSCGTKVLYLTGCGTSETMVEGVTGLGIKNSDPEEIYEGILKLDQIKTSEERIMRNAKRFSKELFIRNFKRVIEQ